MHRAECPESRSLLAALVSWEKLPHVIFGYSCFRHHGIFTNERLRIKRQSADGSTPPGDHQIHLGLLLRNEHSK